jgi:hypothetical protein
MPAPLKIYLLQDSQRAQELLTWCRDPVNRARMVTTTDFGTSQHYLIVEDTWGITPSPVAEAEQYWQSAVIETEWPE